METRDYEGNAVPRAAFTVDLVRHEWQKPEGPSVGKTSGVTDAQGKATVQIAVRSGWYQARAVSKTPEGREVDDTTYLWVTGGFDWYGGGGQQRVEIVPDKKSYKAGEKARVLIVTGVPDAYVWVTVEGRTVNGSQLVHAKGGSATVEIPIVSDYAPNFFLTAVFLKDQKYYAGTKSVKVPPVEQQLSVELKASKAQYKPGDSGVFTLDAKDSGGRPVTAEFSLGVVDEAIYAIRKESVQEILAFFYGKKWNRVNTDTSLSYYFQGEAGKRRMQLARVRPGKALGIIKPEKLVEAEGSQALPGYDVLDGRPAHGRARARAGGGDIPRRADDVAGHGARHHGRFQGGERDRADYRTQEPDPAAGGAAVLPRRRRGDGIGAGGKLPGEWEERQGLARRARA